MFKKTFSKDFMIDEVLLGKLKVLDENVGNSRWSEHNRLVFKTEDGKYWETSYSRGLTEMQDEGPWEYETEVEAIQVTPYEKVVVDYKPIKDRKDFGNETAI